jgi:hypothetical protein
VSCRNLDKYRDWGLCVYVTLEDVNVYICTMCIYVQCVYMYNVYICTMCIYVQCVYMYNVYICTMCIYVQCMIQNIYQPPPPLSKELS